MNKSLSHKLIHAFNFRIINTKKSGEKSYQNIDEKSHIKRDNFRTLNALNKTSNNIFLRLNDYTLMNIAFE